MFVCNQDFEQNRRLSNHTNSQWKALVTELDRNAQSLERPNGGLGQMLQCHRFTLNPWHR